MLPPGEGLMVSLHSRRDGQVEVTAASLAVQVDSLRRQGRLTEANEQADRALGLFPDHADLLIACGRLSLAEGRPQEALGKFTDARKITAGDHRPVVWQIAAYSQL